jgi:hypothetical protein
MSYRRSVSKMVMLGVAALPAVAACSREQAPAAAAASGSSAVVPIIATIASTASSVPVKEDFERQAREAITEENVEAQVKALESEISEK